MRSGRRRLALCDDLAGADGAALSPTEGRDDSSVRHTPPDANVARFAHCATRNGAASTDVHATVPDVSGPVSLKIGSPLRAAITPTVRGPRDRRVRTGARAPVLPTLPALAAESRAAADGHGVLAAHSGVPGRAEPRPPSVTAALAGPPIRRLRLEAVRPTDRAASPAEAAATRHVAPCDAETGADLDGIAAAAAAVPDVIAVGSPRRAAVFGRPRDTARRAPARLGVTRLDLLHQVHPGAVRTRTGAHHEIVTRPGSHGGPDSLLPIARQPRHTDHQEDP